MENMKEIESTLSSEVCRADEEAQLDKDALDSAAAAALGQQQLTSSSSPGMTSSQQAHRKAIAEMTGGG